MNEVDRNEVEELVSVSALPDFAQIYSFLQYFGRLLLLPKITLNELENFFEKGKRHEVILLNYSRFGVVVKIVHDHRSLIVIRNVFLNKAHLNTYQGCSCQLPT